MINKVFEIAPSEKEPDPVKPGELFLRILGSSDDELDLAAARFSVSGEMLRNVVRSNLALIFLKHASWQKTMLKHYWPKLSHYRPELAELGWKLPPAPRDQNGRYKIEQDWREAVGAFVGTTAQKMDYTAQSLANRAQHPELKTAEPWERIMKADSSVDPKLCIQAMKELCEFRSQNGKKPKGVILRARNLESGCPSVAPG
jgi:hypothetical protein